MSDLRIFPRYDPARSYRWNYDHAPDPIDVEVPTMKQNCSFCGLPVDSPLGVPAGPLLNGRWCLYYASLGFDVLTYKTVRSQAHECYPLPNLQPVTCGQISDAVSEVPATADMTGSWAVSYGMPSMEPDVWRSDVEATRSALPNGKLLSVSVVGTIQAGWTIEDLADDYARCAKWAVDSGADIIETNFSCPNVSTCDGQLYQTIHDAQLVAHRVRDAIGGMPYVVKIGHVASRDHATELLDGLQTHIDALAMTNSVATHVRDGSNLMFDGQKRGICGHGILEASLTQLQMFSEITQQQRIQVALIGVGGIGSAADVQRYLNAGAQACHIATAAMTNPAIALNVKRTFVEQMQ